ncbi:unnamed protein product [Linum trigynum]|uniref:Gnk2-homologous domain-containing protein n=1 Tax=Linum trigynum TaxID=586398 RepID=A0AAV2GEX7_9ROSI
MARRISSLFFVTMATLQLLLAICCPQASCFNQTLCAGSDGNGRCSLDSYPVPTSVAQDSMFTDFGDWDHFRAGDLPGCTAMRYVVGENEYWFTVHASFSCDGAPSEDCRQCWTDGSQRLKEGCLNRAGGSVLMEKCCVRYELYDFCA